MTHPFVEHLGRGMNLGGWLSQSKRRGAERQNTYRATDAESLPRAGFHHVRLPVDEEQLWTEDGRREEDWNRVFPFPYRAIRDAEPDRLVLIGSNKWNQASTFPELAVPENDPHLLLTFHYYNPMPITHYRASWVAACAAYGGPLQFPGSPIPESELAKVPEPHRAVLASWNEPFGPDTIRRQLRPVLEVRDRTGLPVYCGEFGVIHQAPPDLVQVWHEVVIEAFEAAGIPWSVWSWKGRFGLTDTEGKLLPWAVGWMQRPCVQPDPCA